MQCMPQELVERIANVQPHIICLQVTPDLAALSTLAHSPELTYFDSMM